MTKLLMLLLTPMMLFGQITKTTFGSSDKGKLKFVYTFLDYNSGQSSDTTLNNSDSLPLVLHGKYECYLNDTLTEEGFYKFGMKDSIWKQYDQGNGQLVTRGAYYYDLKDGEWEYYTKAGKIYKKYNFTSKETVVLDSTYEADLDSRIFQYVEIPPRFIGGEEALLNFLSKNIKYPNYARDHGIQGRVYVTFVIDKDGSVIQVKVLKGIGGGLDEEALRVVNLMSNNMWTPGYQNGRPVKVQYNMPIVFSVKN